MIAADRRAGFGDEAERFVAGLPPDTPVIAAAPNRAAEAFAEAVRRRRNGETFFVAPLIGETRALVALDLAAPAMAQNPPPDRQRTAMTMLAANALGVGTQKQHEIAAYAMPELRALADFAMMSPALLCRSHIERRRVEAMLSRRRPYGMIGTGMDRRVPPARAVRGDAIVVWAPDLRADQLGIIAFAAAYRQMPLLCVCRPGVVPGGFGRVIDPANADDALARASVVIDAAIGDPASAIALARWGIPLLVATTSGAAEYVAGVREYEPWDWTTVFQAIAAAHSDPAPQIRRDPFDVAERDALLASLDAPVPARTPLASIVVPTYNRRHLLTRALRSLERQTYPNLEIVVVNDAGDDVSDIVAAVPRARGVLLERNGGPFRAIAAGMREARGAYVGMVSDDDELFPDHLTRLVTAMERSGAGHAHGTAVTRFVRPGPGGPEVFAYRLMHDRTVDPLDALAGVTYPQHAMLFRREFIDQIGELDVDLTPSDYEYQIRAYRREQPAYVDVPVAMWTYDTTGKTFTHNPNMERDMLAIYARYGDAGSEYVRFCRDGWLREFRDAGATPIWKGHVDLPRPEPL